MIIVKKMKYKSYVSSLFRWLPQINVKIICIKKNKRTQDQTRDKINETHMLKHIPKTLIGQT